jgi:hypothetical protein
MQSVSRLLASGFILSLLFAAIAYAQGSQTGGLTGVVNDQSGALVRGATVDIIDESTGRSVRNITTGDDGGYAATLLPPGNYRLEVTAPNFKKIVVQGVSVTINQTTRQDVTLEAGRIEETVNIEAALSLINPTSPVTGQGLEAQTLRRLPLASPNVLFLTSLSTGTASEPVDVRGSGRGNIDVNVNGQRTTNNSVTLDGINVNDFNLAHFDTIPLPNPSTIQELKVATSLYDAASGSKGGGALGLVLKSGQKDFHGELYWSHRNDALNANEWFRNTQATLRPPGEEKAKRARLLQNVFGGSASGPVPWAGGFWFFNYQGVRGRNGLDPAGASLNPLIQAFPTNSDGTTSAALLASAFSLTPAQIDPVAVSILNLRSDIYGGQFFIPRLGQGGCASVPTGGATGSFRCFFSKIIPIEANQHTISYDRSWRDGADKISGRWFWDNGSALRPYGTASNLAFPSASVQNNRFLSITHTHQFGATKINELRAGYSRFISSFIPEDLVSLADIGAARPNAGEVPGVYQVGITGLFSFGTGVNDERGTISNNYNLSDTFSWSFGKHNLRFGGEGTQYQLNRFNRFAIRGALTFGATSGTGNAFTAFQNFLQGRITGLQSAAGDPGRNFVATDFAGFVQDDYRYSSRLTFNVGLRWEAMSYGRDKLYRGGIYDPSLLAQGQNPFLFPANVNLGGVTGTPGVSDCALDRCLEKDNWAPRLGFAWDIYGDQKTILRGGYGIYYQRLSNQNILQGSLAPPFFVQLIDSRAIPAAFQLANPLGSQPPAAGLSAFVPQVARFAGLRILPNAPAGTTLDVNNPFVAPIFVNDAGQACANYGGTAGNCVINLASFATATRTTYTPYTQQYNLTIQRELWKGWAVEGGYVGTRYIGGLGIWNPHLAPLASPSSPIVVRDINGVSYTITANTVSNEELRHQVLGLSRKRGARYTDNIGQGTYHSGQFTLSRRLQAGLYFQAAYTWSKNIDNVSGSMSTDELNVTRAGQGGANVLNNFPQVTRAISDFDRPHRFVLSYSYDIPVPKGSFFNNQLFKGWSIGGIVTYQSGLPFGVTDSTAGGAFGYTGGLNTATLSGQCTSLSQFYTTGSIQNRLNAYLNAGCFATRAPDVPNAAGSGATALGNVPRNAFRGPFQQNWDFSVTKRFTLMEKHAFQFRTEFFNLWNHPVFRFPSAVNIGTPTTFGQITETAVPARLIQFGLRYEFR